MSHKQGIHQVFQGCWPSSQLAPCHALLGQFIRLACAHLLYHSLHMHIWAYQLGHSSPTTCKIMVPFNGTAQLICLCCHKRCLLLRIVAIALAFRCMCCCVSSMQAGGGQCNGRRQSGCVQQAVVCCTRPTYQCFPNCQYKHCMCRIP